MLLVSVYDGISGGQSFAPLYQCLYIYQSLGMEDQFAEAHKLRFDSLLTVLVLQEEQRSPEGLSPVDSFSVETE